MEKITERPDHMIGRTPATIRSAFDAASAKSCRMLAESEGDMGNINMSDVITVLIQYAGRFVERYASDLVISLDSLRMLTDRIFPVDGRIDEVFAFGMRRCGVDHNEFVISRLKDTMRGTCDSFVYAEQVYRKVLAVHVVIDPAERAEGCPHVSVVLCDITDDLYKMDGSDLDK